MGSTLDSLTSFIDGMASKAKAGRLLIWGLQVHARPGWTLVTGKKSEIDKVAMALTGAPAVKGEHSPVVFIGSDKTGRWIRAYGLAEPGRFASLIDEVTAAHVAPH